MKFKKFLALGPDIVMSGYLFVLDEEALREIGYFKTIEEFTNDNFITKEEYEKLRKKIKPFRDYFEMSTKKEKVQLMKNPQELQKVLIILFLLNIHQINGLIICNFFLEEFCISFEAIRFYKLIFIFLNYFFS